MHFDSKNRGSIMERSLGAGKEPVESKEFSPRKRWPCHRDGAKADISQADNRRIK